MAMAPHAMLGALDHISIELSRTRQSSEVSLSKEQCRPSSRKLQISSELGTTRKQASSSPELPEAASVCVSRLLPPGGAEQVFSLKFIASHETRMSSVHSSGKPAGARESLHVHGRLGFRDLAL